MYDWKHKSPFMVKAPQSRRDSLSQLLGVRTSFRVLSGPLYWPVGPTICKTFFKWSKMQRPKTPLLDRCFSKHGLCNSTTHSPGELVLNCRSRVPTEMAWIRITGGGPRRPRISGTSGRLGLAGVNHYLERGDWPRLWITPFPPVFLMCQ